MQKINAFEFQEKCIEIIDQVYETGEDIIITKSGVPVALLQAYREKSQIVSEPDTNTKKNTVLL